MLINKVAHKPVNYYRTAVNRVVTLHYTRLYHSTRYTMSQQNHTTLNVITNSTSDDTDEYKDTGGYAEAKHNCSHIITNVNTAYNYHTLNYFTTPQHCIHCTVNTELWLCLQCNQLYCSRYQNQHMIQHYNQTQHCICCNLADLSFWCYQCESYIYHITQRTLYNIYQYLHQQKFGEYAPQPITIHDLHTIYNPTDTIIQQQQINKFAVYGTLRTDDHTNSAWTANFVKDVTYSIFGRVTHCKLYQAPTNNFPYAVQTQSLDTSITVQILTFDNSVVPAKLIEADEIENYSVDNESESEYIRRAVYVHTTEHTVELCWIYFVNPKLYETNWRSIDTGDWCRQTKT